MASKQISIELANSFIMNAQNRYTIDYLCNYTQGLTYITFEDIINIQLFESNDNNEIEVVKDNPGTSIFIQVPVRRSWQRVINILQTEDLHGYGTQFLPVPQFENYEESSCLTWTMFAILNSCKEFWDIVDSKESLYRWSGC